MFRLFSWLRSLTRINIIENTVKLNRSEFLDLYMSVSNLHCSRAALNRQIRALEVELVRISKELQDINEKLSRPASRNFKQAEKDFAITYTNEK